ncbi:MAG: hypothetical protein IPH07_15360 [Deltaproteobacteria bacterium]|nr:hypothetical protein [Deltaproteobacteria bacterium]MBK8239156.1 hypothetical protein [Deltaproteobacteria bacterium]MBK8717671.1 hypothetical protein [Deltaproteobacteria bacterium]
MNLRSFVLSALAGLMACQDPDADDTTTTAADGSSSGGGSMGADDGASGSGSSGGADASSSSTGGGADESEGGSADSSGGSTGAAMTPYDCVDADFTIDLPLAGPGYDPEAGLIDPQAQYLVSTTQAMPRPDALQQFGELATAAGMAAAQSPGVVAVSFASEPNCGFARTLTVWRDQASMLSFVVSPEHAAAIDATYDVTLGGRTTHFTIDADQMPVTWEVALEHIADVEPF